MGEPFFGNPELGQNEILGKDQDTGYRPVTLGEPAFGNPELGQNEIAADANNFGEPIRLAYLFSGLQDERDPDSFVFFARQLRCEVVWYELEADPPQDLLDDTLFSGILSDISQGKKDGGMMSPPCSTFSGVRNLDDGQYCPRPLRGPEMPELLGLAGLDYHEANRVKVGTACRIEQPKQHRRGQKFHPSGTSWRLGLWKLLRSDPTDPTS